MKDKTKFLIFSLVLLAAFLAVGPVSAASVAPVPIDFSVLQNEIFGISIEGTAFPETFGGGVLVEWDADLLTVIAYDSSGAVADGWDIGNPGTFNPGSVLVSVATFFAANSNGSFTIADLQFQASGVNTGNSFFNLTPIDWDTTVSSYINASAYHRQRRPHPPHRSAARCRSGGSGGYPPTGEELKEKQIKRRLVCFRFEVRR